jgi:hypothetical protein
MFLEHIRSPVSLKLLASWLPVPDLADALRDRGIFAYFRIFSLALLSGIHVQ